MIPIYPGIWLSWFTAAKTRVYGRCNSGIFLEWGVLEIEHFQKAWRWLLLFFGGWLQ